MALLQEIDLGAYNKINLEEKAINSTCKSSPSANRENVKNKNILIQGDSNGENKVNRRGSTNSLRAITY